MSREHRSFEQKKREADKETSGTTSGDGENSAYSRHAGERGSIYHAGNAKEAMGLPEEERIQERLISKKLVLGK